MESSWSYESLSPRVQTHLKLVYLTLCCALGASALGVYLQTLVNVGGFVAYWGWTAGIFWFSGTPPSEERTRFGILMVISLLEGAFLGPLLKFTADVDPSITVIAFVGTAITFGCLSGAAIVAKRRVYIYLGGLLSSDISILLWLKFASSIYGQSAAVFNVYIYLGLLIFLVYVMFDTEDIIQRAHLGDLDYVKHAFALTTNFWDILLRIVTTMWKKASESLNWLVTCQALQ